MKINNILDDYSTFKTLIEQDNEDPPKQIKNLLKRGVKCQKKWAKVEDFYERHFSSKV